MYAVHPEITERQWHFWTSVFSACLVLGATCIHAGDTPFSTDALVELEAAVTFFERGSRRCRHAGTMPSLQRLLRQSRITVKGKMPPNYGDISNARGTDREICLLACPQKWFLKTAAAPTTVSANALRVGQQDVTMGTPDLGTMGGRWALYPDMGGNGDMAMSNGGIPHGSWSTAGQVPLPNAPTSMNDGLDMFGYGEQGYSASPDYVPFAAGMVGNGGMQWTNEADPALDALLRDMGGVPQPQVPLWEALMKDLGLAQNGMTPG